jgi:hypothetical protein
MVGEAANRMSMRGRPDRFRITLHRNRPLRHERARDARL